METKEQKDPKDPKDPKKFWIDMVEEIERKIERN